MTDYEEQFQAKLYDIAREELKELKVKEFINKVLDRIAFYREHPERNPLISKIEIDDYEYQTDIDTELSLISQQNGNNTNSD